MRNTAAAADDADDGAAAHPLAAAGLGAEPPERASEPALLRARRRAGRGCCLPGAPICGAADRILFSWRIFCCFVQERRSDSPAVSQERKDNVVEKKVSKTPVLHVSRVPTRAPASQTAQPNERARTPLVDHEDYDGIG